MIFKDERVVLGDITIPGDLTGLNWAGFGCLSSTRPPTPRLLHSPVSWRLHRAKHSQCSHPKDRNSACSPEKQHMPYQTMIYTTILYD